jgi:hypothetical protein
VSAPVPVFLCTIDARGRVQLERPIDYGRWLMTLAGERGEMIVRKRRTRRSNQANARYWALLTVAAREIGYDDPEDLHEGLALKFLRLTDDEKTGLPRRQRTPKCSTSEFADYTDKCERYFVNDLHLDLTGWSDECDRLQGAA